MQNQSEPPRIPASPVPPIDYRPRTVDGASRHWPLWAGLAIVTAMAAAAVIFITRQGVARPPLIPRTVAVPATQPATGPSVDH